MSLTFLISNFVSEPWALLYSIITLCPIGENSCDLVDLKITSLTNESEYSSKWNFSSNDKLSGTLSTSIGSSLYLIDFFIICLRSSVVTPLEKT